MRRSRVRRSLASFSAMTISSRSGAELAARRPCHAASPEHAPDDGNPRIRLTPTLARQLSRRRKLRLRVSVLLLPRWTRLSVDREVRGVLAKRCAAWTPRREPPRKGSRRFREDSPDLPVRAQGQPSTGSRKRAVAKARRRQRDCAARRISSSQYFARVSSGCCATIASRVAIESSGRPSMNCACASDSRYSIFAASSATARLR